jgi:hypothetical protein
MTGVLETIVPAVLALASAIALTDWRKGLLLCLAVGFLQDPLRKLWPGEPVYLTALVGIVLVIAAAGAAARGELLTIKTTTEWRIFLWLPITAFGLVVLLQAARTVTEYQSITLAVLGLIGYLAPLAAAALGYSFARNPAMLKIFLGCYAVLSVAAATGVYLAFLGYDWPVLEEVGEGLIVFSHGLPLDAYAGFMRTPEVTAWHAGAGACLLVILGVVAKQPRWRLAAGVLILVLVGAALLTGRRKATVEILLFVGVYWLALAYARAGATRVAAVAAVAVFVVWFAIPQLLEPEEMDVRLEPYVRHSATGFSDAPERFTALGLGSVEWAIRRHGMLGTGAGTGSQGAQHFGGGVTLVGGAPEGGLGKIATELGLPGLLAAAWVMAALIRVIWSGQGRAQRLSPERNALRYGLLAFLSAKSVGFIVAAQIYGDLFVLLLLGWTLGFILAIPRLEATPCTSFDRAQASRAPLNRKRLRQAPRLRIGQSARRVPSR